MTRTVPLLLAIVAACGGGAASTEVDCATIVGDPGTALTKLTVTTSDPGRVWARLEECFAPKGDTCDRAAVGLAMTPSMALAADPTAIAERDASYKKHADQCRTLPAEKQRCLLISYSSSHPACGAVQEQFRRDHPPS